MRGVTMLGPIDYVVVGFKGNNFDGSILKALSEAMNKNIIRVIDLVFIMKDKDGTVVDGEYEDQSKDLQATFGTCNKEEDMPLLSESDIQKVGKEMDNDTAAGVLVFEHLWAKDLKKGIMDAGGFLI